MIMVQRYSGMGSTWTMPREDGDYVKYEDYAELEMQLLALRKEREAAVPAINVIFKDGWPIPETVGVIAGSEKLSDGAHDLYAAPPAQPDDEGQFVQYEDYVALLSSVETLHAMVKLGYMQVEHISGFLDGILLVVKE